MPSITKILIPTDFSETANLAVAHGANMAHLFNARIFLLHSVETSMYAAGLGEPVLMADAENVFKSGVEQLDKQVEEIKKKYKVDITTLIGNGKPATAITSAVKEHEIDVVIMGTHGASGFEEFFMGSNAHKVVSLSTCPVISIRNTTKNIGFSNIVMPITNGFQSRQKVNNVIDIATKYKSTVHLIGLLETTDTIDDNKFKIKVESVEHLLKQENIKFTSKLTRTHNPASEAMRFSEEIGADLMVIMTDHESDLTGIFLGAGAKQIVNHSKIPIMSIRPVETMVDAFDPSGGSGTL